MPSGGSPATRREVSLLGRHPTVPSGGTTVKAFILPLPVLPHHCLSPYKLSHRLGGNLSRVSNLEATRERLDVDRGAFLVESRQFVMLNLTVVFDLGYFAPRRHHGALRDSSSWKPVNSTRYEAGSYYVLMISISAIPLKV